LVRYVRGSGRPEPLARRLERPTPHPDPLQQSSRQGVLGRAHTFVVAAPQYRAAANTAMGWKNSNLRTEMTRLLRRAGVSGWPQLFHSMRANTGNQAPA
jgi:hypothetical protein